MNHRSFFLGCIALAAITLPTACGKAIDGTQGAQPRVVVHNYPQHVDRSVVRWDSPVFVAYTDGVVIWRKAWASSVSALTETKSQKASAAAGKLEALVASNGEKTIKLTDSSDPEVTTVWSAGKTLTINGDWRKPRVLEAGDLANAQDVARINAEEKKLWALLPADIRETLTEIAAFDDAAGKPWRPEKLSVTLQPSVKARGQIVPWPAQWPRSFATVPGSQDMKWLELPGSALDEVIRLFPSDGEPRAVQLAGETRYAEIRLIFPGEAAWREAPK